MWCGAGAASAQLIPSAGVPPLKRVEAGTSDINPLATSNRVLPTDLRVPTGFESLYSFQQRDAFGNLQTYYVRSDGGLTAIFPRSQYSEGRNGPTPEVPAGTVWVIGPLKIQQPVRQAPKRSYNALNFSIDDRAPAPNVRPPIPVAPEAAASASIWGDERYRQWREGRLLDSMRAHHPQ